MCCFKNTILKDPPDVFQAYLLGLTIYRLKITKVFGKRLTMCSAPFLSDESCFNTMYASL